MAFSKISKVHAVVILMSTCLLVQLCISHKLWYPAGREFPLLSAFSFLPVTYGLVLDALLGIVAFVCLLIILFRPFSKWVISVLIFVFALLILEDVTRLQPWLYLFSILLATVTVFGKQNEEQLLFVFRVVLAVTYFWSGVQKFNHAFTTEVFPWLMGPLGLKNFFEMHHRLGYMIPVIELSVGLGLLSQKWQRFSSGVLICIHLLLICSLGPWGNNWNILIWPWNIAMAAIIYMVTFQSSYPGFVLSVKPLMKSKCFITVIILTGLMPVFNYIGCWDNYLSGSLYSGTIPEAIFYYDKSTNNAPLVTVQNSKLYYPEREGEYFIVDGWALEELNAPVYPEARYFKKIAKYLCNKEKDKSKAGLLIVKRKKFTAELYQQDCKCDSLLKSQ